MDQPNPPRRAESVTAPETNLRDEAAPAATAAEAAAPQGPPAPAPPPLSARGWLAQNGPWLVFLAAAFAFGYVQFGAEMVLAFLFALLGLGFVIFIHELGHFLAAKWCDVHVLTFSIGFGPALPGCSFTRGETTYKLALLPLGGYVNMVGEGPEADEDEEYPRSFKNKSVGARMLIISAGVIMNVLFGAVCFILLYRFHGVQEDSAIFWRVEPGARAWAAGVQPGWKVVRLNDRDDPTFQQMMRAVFLSAAGKPLEFTFVDRQGNLHEKTIEPYRDENGLVPIIGVLSAPKLELVSKSRLRDAEGPVSVGSAASFARVLQLGKDDVLLRASDPVQPDKLTPLPAGTAGWLELCRRMERAGSKELTVEVARGGEKGKAETVRVPAEGFEFGDRIVGTTDPATPDRPYNLSELPLDPEHDRGKDLHDPFVFRDRMAQLAGLPAVIQVRRAGSSPTSPPLSVLVPPAYHVTLGMTFKMGKVAAIRPGSPAEGKGLKAGFSDGDVITGVKLRQGDGTEVVFDAASLDPLRLPYELERRVRGGGKWQVILTVKGKQNHDMQKERTLAPMDWDDRYKLGEEAAISAGAPLSIPQLGIAYWVETEVVQVQPGSPAEKAGLKRGDVVTAYQIRSTAAKRARWSDWDRLVSRRGKEKEVYDHGAGFFQVMQAAEAPAFRLRVLRGGEASPLDLPEGKGWTEGIEPVADLSWPAINRGVSLQADKRPRKASTLWEALGMGVEETLSTIGVNYRSMSSLATGRISTRTIGGPIEILYQVMMAARENPWTLARLLGIISIGLAVVNFLPIPVLDGGHMVFLLYEKLRGKPPSESVRVVATYLGLALILALMVYVFGMDFIRRILPGLRGWFGG